MAALESFEATEANLSKLERLWSEIKGLVPEGVSFGGSAEHEDRCRSYARLLVALPKIDRWRPTIEPMDLDHLAQNRLDAMDLGLVEAQAAIERELDSPGRELREYRFRLDAKRRQLIRNTLVGLIDEIDVDVGALWEAAFATDPPRSPSADDWTAIGEHIRQVETLMGSSVPKPPRWSDMRRHVRFAEMGDLEDIFRTDWPSVRTALRKTLFGENEPLPVRVDDLADLVAAKPGGSVSTALSWGALDDTGFERLLFSLIIDAKGYENPEWLMKTRAPDRGRDLSVTRVTNDPLAGTSRRRVVIQCKHWLSKSVAVPEIAESLAQMEHWTSPPVDVLVIATSGRFTSDAVSWIEGHNAKGIRPKIEMWPESHLEMLLTSRPALIADAGLR